MEIIETNTALPVPFEDGRYVYRFPTNGSLFVRDARSFRKAHTARAVRDDGIDVPVLIPSDPEPLPGGTALFQIYNYDGHFNFFIGSREEMGRYMSTVPQQTEAGRFLAGETTNVPPELKGLFRR